MARLLRRVPSQPEQFRQHVEGRCPLAGERKQRLGAIARQDVVALGGRVTVQPVDGVAQRPVGRVQEHERDALRAHRDAAYRAPIGGRGVQRSIDSLQRQIPPRQRVLLDHRGRERDEAVFEVAFAQNDTPLIVNDSFAARGAQVDADE